MNFRNRLIDVKKLLVYELSFRSGHSIHICNIVIRYYRSIRWFSMPHRGRTKQVERQQGATGSALVYNIAAKIDEISAPRSSRAQKTPGGKHRTRITYLYSEHRKRWGGRCTRIEKKWVSDYLDKKMQKKKMARTKLLMIEKHLFVINSTRLQINIENLHLKSTGESDIIWNVFFL